MSNDLNARVAVLETDMDNLKNSLKEQKETNDHNTEILFKKIDTNAEAMNKIAKIVYIGMGGIAGLELALKLGEWLVAKKP